MTTQFSLLPESAPFTEEQRAWLNGFLAGWIGLQAGATLPLNGSQMAHAAALTAPEVAAPAVVEEDFPWHDPAIALDDRLSLAESRPLPRRLMAAMAQLNCGSCGYDCRRYAEAIANGDEQSLKLCSPGGKETAKKLKELVTLALPVSPLATHGHSNGPTNGHTNGHSVPTPVVSANTAAWNRANPYAAAVRVVRNLNGDGSDKQTSHVELDLAGSGLIYEVGDSLGVYPTNCPELVQELLQVLSASGNEPVHLDGESLPLQQALAERFCLTDITDELVEHLQQVCRQETSRAWLQQLSESTDAVEGWDVLELLKHVPEASLSLTELPRLLSPLKPRLYSISSSLKACPDQVHLTVGRVGWQFRERHRKGVASTMFADRVQSGDRVRVFVQKSHGFTVPKDPQAAAIMIGPGTGIAPFRAFLQERKAAAAPGENWLFFGDQRSATDFLYRDELEELSQSGCLTRLDVAFSRDQAEKIYVQNRMLENGAEFWSWLQDGAHVYVCGDAKRMAVDVDRALRQIIAQHGRLDSTAVDQFVARMVADKRYCRDVY